MAKKSRKVRRAAKSKQGSFERLFVEGEELFVEGTAEYGMVMRWLRGHPAIKGHLPPEGVLQFHDGSWTLSLPKNTSPELPGAEMQSTIASATVGHELGHVLHHRTAPIAECQLLLPPGTRLRGWLGLLFWSSRARTQFLDAILADVQHEWLKAHQRGDTKLARRIQVFGLISLFWAMLRRIPETVLSLLLAVWKRTMTG